MHTAENELFPAVSGVSSYTGHMTPGSRRVWGPSQSCAAASSGAREWDPATPSRTKSLNLYPCHLSQANDLPPLLHVCELCELVTFGCHCRLSLKPRSYQRPMSHCCLILGCSVRQDALLTNPDALQEQHLCLLANCFPVAIQSPSQPHRIHSWL